ncbi:MAG: DUF2283 domain-containing protein [Clostridium butyricum]
MMSSPIAVPQEKMIYRYSKNSDILDVYLEIGKRMISEEISDGVYEHFDLVTDSILGISIENYRNQDKNKLHRILPFVLDFRYIDSKICN